MLLPGVRRTQTSAWCSPHHALHSPHLYTSGATKAHVLPPETSQQRELALNLLSSSFRTCGVVMVLLMRTLVMEP